MYCLYSITAADGRVYYGSTNDTKKRWQQHKYNRMGVVRQMLDESKCEMKVLEYFDNYEEARLTEALVIETFPCVNRRSELLDVIIDTKKDYGKLYRSFNYDLFNKKGKCRYCGLLMIDRNLKRHYNRCKILN
jgi:predicted GIY-YIG superfamily endonuclease